MAFCQGCGSEVAQNAAVCLSCGRALTQAPPTYANAPPPAYAPPPIYGGYAGMAPYKVENYLALSIVSLVVGFCTGCLAIPFGIAAVVFAAQVDGKAAAGDIAGATNSSNQAKRWSIISFCVAGVNMVLSLVLNLLPFLALFSGGGLE